MTLCKNYDDVVSQLRSAGLEIDGPLEIGTSNMVRCYMDGERKKKRGAYRLYEMPLSGGDTIIVGTYGYAQGAEYFFFKVALPKGGRAELDAEQLAAIRKRQAEDRKRAEADRKRKAESASAAASRWWRQCKEEGDSPYLTRKGLPKGNLFGARISTKSGNLVIPVQDGDGKTWGLQVIYHDPATKRRKGRDKDFTPPGLAKKGHWFQVGSPVSGGVLLLCEGFATGCSLHLATGLPVAVAFDAFNLTPVGEALRKRYRGVRILVCADDDYLTTPNTGIDKGKLAAMAVSGACVWPVFDGERSQDKTHKGPTDFNDLHTHPAGGLSAVRGQIESALASAGWRAPDATARGESANGGEGDGGARRAAVSTLPLDDLVDRFIHVDDVTGEFVFDTWTSEVCKFSKVVKMLPARVRTDDIKDHPTWRSRAVYIDQIGFDPGGDDQNIVCNRWGGWPTTPKEGKCEVLLELLHYLCSNEPNCEEVYRWLLCWLAYPIQHPGAKLQSAAVIHGPQGTGKSRFFEAYAKIYGEYSIVLNQGAIEDKFNSDWSERKLFILADEIVARSDMYHLKNQLKSFITGEWVRVNPKNVAAHRERNHMNLLFLSNEKQPVVLENDDRRHLVLWTPPKLSPAFYEDVDAEIEAGGIEALHHYLLNLDLGDFRPWSHPPMTGAKQDLIDINRESVDRFIGDWSQGDIEGVPFCPCGSSDLYGAYAQWCRREGVKAPRESNQFIGHIAKLPGWTKAHKDRYENTQYIGATVRQRMIIPPEELLLEAHTRHGQRDRRKKADKTLTQWMTDSFFEFRSAMQGSAT